jgi:ferritin-like protein
MSSISLHEPVDRLTEHTINCHRAIVSLMEELEAIDWYNQRADVCGDAQLRAVLEHNRDEEIEHASMTLEWIRRSMPKFAAALKLYLFTEGDITAIEEQEQDQKDGASSRADESARRFTIGAMKEE